MKSRMVVYTRRGSRVLDTGQVKMRNKDQDYYQVSSYF